MKYKLLVLDVDGTLLNDAKEISKRTLAALLKDMILKNIKAHPYWMEVQNDRYLF